MKEKQIIPTVFISLVLVIESQCANILGVFPLNFKSHYIIYQSVMKELARRGHNVTVINPFPMNEAQQNYTDIDIKECFNLAGSFVFNDVHMQRNPFLKTYEILHEGGKLVERMFQCEKLKQFLSRNDSYDLVITEIFHGDVTLGFVDKFQAHHVAFCPASLSPWAADRMGNPSNPSYIPYVRTDEEFDRFHPTFYQRLYNTLCYLFAETLYFHYSYGTEDIAQRVFGTQNSKLDEIAKNTSLVLSFSHFSFNAPVPLVPGVIEIAGLQITQEESLPEDIQKFIDESEHGVIYFCMGSLIKMETFPESKRIAFLRAFSKLPQRVIWKWDGDLPGQTDQIFISKWMPQRDILAHPNVKLFIAHGGALGLNEAIHEGVPVLGIPMYGDQTLNLRRLQANGAADILDYSYIDTDTVFTKITQVLQPKYAINMKKLSKIFKDRPMSAMDTAIYWIEYVIRHEGAHHLRTAAVDLPFYQYLLLDVIAFLITVVSCAIFFAYYLAKKLWSFCRWNQPIIVSKKTKQIISKVFILLVLVIESQCANILGVFPLNFKSHYIIYQSVMKELARRGHNVTVINPFPMNQAQQNYTDIDITECFNYPMDDFDLKNVDPHSNLFLRTYKASIETSEILRLIFQCEKLKQFLKTNDSYDLVITELFDGDVNLVFVHKFQAHHIALSPNPLPSWAADRVGNPSNPSYMPYPFNDEEFDRFRPTFYQRLRNTLLDLFVKTINFYLSYGDEDVTRNIFGADIPRLDEIAKNTSLILSFSHFSFNTPVPLVPSVVEVAGLQIAEAKPLPEDIRQFIDGSEHGVIYFCMGSLLRSETMPEPKRLAFLSAFSKLPQRIIWKWDGELQGKTDQIFISKWMPQRDILAHPNVKLFIAHGGSLGLNEAIYEQVPVLGIPMFADQTLNLRRLQANGVAEILDYSDINADTVFAKITQVLQPKYAMNMKKLSKIFKDRPMSAMDTAIYWIEYVIRHEGARHLRTAAVDLPLYQYLLLDVIAFLITAVSCAIFFACYLTRKLWSFCRWNQPIIASKKID
ncbi:uncharacterized protein LOC135845124 [Planococcus citri]|uniref:uncharacterized protein LOC135845124 n=1 Tax=Planococcus citri TaxID=170843 RepID=UPI0031F728B9